MMADDYSYYGGGLGDFEASLSGWDPSSYVMPEAYSQDYYDYLTNVGQTNPEIIRAFFKEFPQEAAQLFGPDAALAMGEGREGVSVSPNTTIGDEELKSLGAGLGLSDVNPSLLKSLLGNKNLLTAGLGGLGALASYKSAQDARKEARGASFKASKPVTATRSAFKGTKYSASGGLMELAGGGVTNPLDYTPSFSDVSGTGLGSGFANPHVQEMINRLDLRADAKTTPELDTLSNQLSQQENDIKNRFLANNVSIDQITGDIDPIQTLRNVRAYDPSTFDATVNSFSDIPERINLESIGNLKSGIKYLGDLGVPYDDLMDVAQSIAEIRTNPDLVGNLSNLAGDIRSVVKPTDEEELGSNYTGLALLQAPKMGEDVTQTRATGGLASLAGGGKTDLPPRYLNGHTDGMADKVPAHIDRKRPAALSDGEFVIPADVVSHLGNGNSNAGAKRLYEMMDRIRSARTGNPKQGKQINPDKFMPR